MTDTTPTTKPRTIKTFGYRIHWQSRTDDQQYGVMPTTYVIKALVEGIAAEMDEVFPDIEHVVKPVSKE